MTSLLTELKQVPKNLGYYIAVSSLTSTISFINTGTDSAPTMTANLAPTAVLAPGTILKDMGKTVVSAGYTFRKVQLRSTAPGTGPVWPDLGTDGVALAAGDRPFYIALPGQHGISAGGTTVPNALVARLG
jgi:hypothetical protein